mgnify:CR=1 FL=1
MLERKKLREYFDTFAGQMIRDRHGGRNGAGAEELGTDTSDPAGAAKEQQLELPSAAKAATKQLVMYECRALSVLSFWIITASTGLIPIAAISSRSCWKTPSA